ELLASVVALEGKVSRRSAGGAAHRFASDGARFLRAYRDRPLESIRALVQPVNGKQSCIHLPWSGRWLGVVQPPFCGATDGCRVLVGGSKVAGRVSDSRCLILADILESDASAQ